MNTRTSAVGGSSTRTTTQHEQRDGDREGACRLERRHVGVDVRQPIRQQARQLARPLAVHPRRPEREQVRREPRAEAALGPRRGGLREGVGGEQQTARGRRRGRDRDEERGHGTERRSAKEDLGDDHAVSNAAAITAAAARTPHATASMRRGRAPGATSQQPALGPGRP